MMRRPLALLLSLALALPVQAYDLPDLGDVASSELSPAAERRIGEQIISQIRWRDAAYLDDPEVEEYLNRIGHRLAAVSNSPGLEFDFFVVNDPTLNACALPGGFIGVHTGLLLAAQTESEFASVLGHEIAHVTQRHIAQIVGKQSQSAMLMIASLLVAVLAARSNSDVSQAAIAAGQAGAIQSQLGYTRAFEREADRVGLDTLDRAGLDVRGMPGFEKGKRLKKLGMKAQDTSELFFQDVRIPKANLLGKEGMGFVYLMQELPQATLRDYATSNGLAWVQDPSNFDMTIDRIREIEGVLETFSTVLLAKKLDRPE